MSYQYEPLSDEYKFQTFLKDLFNAIHDSYTFEEYGTKGHKQHGIDVYSPGLKIAVQAKKKDIHRGQSGVVKELLADLSETVKQFENFPHPIVHLYFATTTKKYIAIQNACMDASRTYGISITFFSWDDIQGKLSDFPSVRNQYFPHLKEAVSAPQNEWEEKISKLEALIAKIEPPNLKTKQYRDIPYTDILLPFMPEDAQKTLTGVIMKIALFQTFSQIQYKRFRCLFNYSASYTQFGDGTFAPGFEIICGEVKFLASCTRLIKELQYNPDRFWEQVDRYMDDKDFNYVKLKMELLPVEGLTCYDFEIDGQTGHYEIKVKKYEGLEYHKLNSLSAILPFIAHSTKSVINVIDYDKISKQPTLMKLFHHMLMDNTFKRSLLKVNVEDFEDWDFEYHRNDEA